MIISDRGLKGYAIVEASNDSPLAFQKGEPFTIETIVYPYANTQFPPEGVNGSYFGKGDKEYKIGQRDGTVEFVIGDGETATTVRSDAVQNEQDFYGKWHRITGIYDGKEMILFVDGKEVGRAPSEGATCQSCYPFEIGRNSESTNERPKVLIQSVQVYKEAISEGMARLSPPLRSTLYPAVLSVHFDQGKVAPTDQFYAGYGSNFGPIDVPNDHNFCMNGLIDTWHTPHPGAYELRKCVENVHLSAQPNEEGNIDSFQLENEYFFRDLSNHQILCTVTKEGLPIAQRSIIIGNDCANPAPGETVSVPLDFTQFVSIPGKGKVEQSSLAEFVRQNAQPGSEFFLNFDVRLVQKEGLLEAGTLVAQSQTRLPIYIEGFSPELIAETQTSVEKTPIDPSSVEFTLDFWRAPTDNDRGNYMLERAAPWRNAGAEILWDAPQQETIDDMIVVKRTGHGKKIDLACQWQETILPCGSRKIAITVERGKDLPDYLRIGTQLRLPKDYDNVTYYGRGPFENYSDRLSAAMVGRYSTTVDDMMVNYSEPSEFGNRTGCRWVELTNASGKGYRFTALNTNGVTTTAQDAATLNFSAKRMLARDLESVDHFWMVPRRDFIVLNIDLAQEGLAGDDSWGARAYEQFCLKDAQYRFEYMITEIQK